MNPVKFPTLGLLVNMRVVVTHLYRHVAGPLHDHCDPYAFLCHPGDGRVAGDARETTRAWSYFAGLENIFIALPDSLTSQERGR